MPDTISTAVTASRFDRAAKLGNANEARERRIELRRGFVELLFALELLKSAGDASGVHAYLGEVSKLAFDGISSRDAELCRTIDEAGIYVERLDLSELEQLITTLERGLGESAVDAPAVVS